MFLFSTRNLFVFGFLLGCFEVVPGQVNSTALLASFEKLAGQQHYRNANISFVLIDKKTGNVLLEKNKDQSLAPASTLKTFTTACALYTLGSNFRFATRVAFKGSINKGIGYGELIVYGSGDPSMGSDRFDETKPEFQLTQISTAIKKMGILTLVGKIKIVDGIHTDESIHTDWLDEDIGNYYGAGVYALNWKENKFEVNLATSKKGFTVSSNTGGYNSSKDFCLHITPKDGASTEEVFAFVEKALSCKYNIKGVLSTKEKSYNLQLASLQPHVDFQQDLEHHLKKDLHFISSDSTFTGKEIPVTTILSPPLSKLVYWCNQKSLNLYAESFCKTMAVKLFKKGSWKLGTSIMARYASSKKIPTKGLSLRDASGLAETNRITVNTLALLLRAFSFEPYFPQYLESIPSINGLRMKSGYIGGTRSYAGYITLRDGSEATFAFIIHNYSCTPKQVKLDMFSVLDGLK